MDINNPLHVFCVVHASGLYAVVNKLTKCLVTGCKQIKLAKLEKGKIKTSFNWPRMVDGGSSTTC